MRFFNRGLLKKAAVYTLPLASAVGTTLGLAFYLSAQCGAMISGTSQLGNTVEFDDIDLNGEWLNNDFTAHVNATVPIPPKISNLETELTNNMSVGCFNIAIVYFGVTLGLAALYISNEMRKCISVENPQPIDPDSEQAPLKLSHSINMV